MNAAVVESFSAPPRYATFADPVPADSEVIVEVKAAGLHPIVRALASGTHYGSTGVPPFIPGVDGTGLLQDGTRIYFGASHPPFGSFSELTLTRRELTIPLAAGLDDSTAAAIANPGMSSWVALATRAKFVSGESVLILGATGSAGKLAIQIAKRRGARHVIAVGRRVNQDALKELGADSVISLDQPHDALVAALRGEINGSGVNVVLDYLWGQPAEAMLEAISQKGLQRSAPRIRYVQIGDTAGKTVALAAATLRSSGLEILGSGFGSASLTQIFQSLAEFFAEATRQPFREDIRTVPLREVESRWTAQNDRARLVFQP